MIDKLAIFILLLLISIETIYSEAPLEQADFYYNKRGIIIDGKPSSENIDKAIYFYETALRENPENEETIYKYVRAIDFKYSYLVEDKEIKKSTFTSLINKLEKYYEKYPESKYINYSLALAWGRYGELLDTLKAARSGIASKLKKYSETVCKIDKTFDNHAALLILGRLHYKAPKIPLILTWPDLEKSKEYFEEVLSNHPDSIITKYYLADTLFALGEKEKAIKYYKEVIKSSPDKNRIVEDLSIQKECLKRMKELGIE